MQRRRGRAGAGVDAAERRREQVGRQAVDLQHRQAVAAARRPSVGRRARARPPASRPPVDAGRAPHHGDVADDERSRPAAPRGTAGRRSPGRCRRHRPSSAPDGQVGGDGSHAPLSSRARASDNRIGRPPRPASDAMRKAWLLFSQTVTVAVALLFVVAHAEAAVAGRSADAADRPPRAAATPVVAAAAPPVQSVALIGPGTAATELQRRRQARLAGGGQHHRQPAPARSAAHRRPDVPLLLRRPGAADARRSARSASARA